MTAILTDAELAYITERNSFAIKEHHLHDYIDRLLASHRAQAAEMERLREALEMCIARMENHPNMRFTTRTAKAALTPPSPVGTGGA